MRHRSADGLGKIVRNDGPLNANKSCNPVIDTCFSVAADSSHVIVNHTLLRELAQSWAKEELTIPAWDAPVFLNGNDDEVTDFLMTVNTINFNYMNPGTGKKYEFSYKDVPWRGSFGQWAAFKNAHENGIPVLDGNFLAGIEEKDLAQILRTDISQIPMLEERVKILREVGKVLVDRFDSHFHNALSEADGRIFNQGKGLTELLVSNFPSFDDRSTYHGITVFFNKRAQLVPMMLHGRFLSKGKKLFAQEDLEALTVAPNYELPKVLRAVGVLEYRGDLARKVDSSELVKAGSDEENEIRANTVYASRLLQEEINQFRPNGPKITALELDYKLFSLGRAYKEAKHHLTMTTAY